jgi:oligogalacturonide lyase
VKKGISRRAVLACMPSAWAAAANVGKTNVRAFPLGSEFVRYPDPTTENPVVRLTHPGHSSVLPSATNHFISVKSRFLVFSADRTGKFSPYRLDLRSGIMNSLAETTQMDPRSLSLDPREHSVYFLDNGALRSVGLQNRKEDRIVVEEGVTAFSSGFAGEFAIVQKRALKLVSGRESRMLADGVDGNCLLQPGGRGCLFWRGNDEVREYWYVATNGASRPVLVAKGTVSNAFWSSQGQSVLFLRHVESGPLHSAEIHEVSPQTCDERCISPTTQFAAFAPNENDSVFVGASGSRVQPHIVLLLRSPHRELTLCEHHAKQAASVSPVFSPDSRRVYFESDRDGKTALYSVNVERLVEPTELSLHAAAAAA